jgi:hypothetical protein
MGIQWGAVEEIPNLSNSTPDEFWPDDNFSDASQSMDELLDANNSLGQDEIFLESLDESALKEIAPEISADKAVQESMEDMPKLDPSSDGMPGYMAAGGGLLSGAAFGKVRSFILSKISSMRNMAEDNDDLGLAEVVDFDDFQNAGTSLGNNGFGEANLSSATPPVGVESAAYVTHVISERMRQLDEAY